jgi:hypothetical protein
MRIYFIILFLSVLFSCKRKSSTSGLPSAREHNSIRSEIQAWPGPWWTAKAKVFVALGGSNVPVNLTLRAEEGKAIWFSASAFGLMEIARGRIDQDSIRILDKFNNRCFRSGLKGLGIYLPVAMGVRQLQHFLMGRVFWDSLQAGTRFQSQDTTRLMGNQEGIQFSAEILAKYNLLKADASVGNAQMLMKNSDFRQIAGFPVAFSKTVRSRIGQEGIWQETDGNFPF